MSTLSPEMRAKLQKEYQQRLTKKPEAPVAPVVEPVVEEPPVAEAVTESVAEIKAPPPVEKPPPAPDLEKFTTEEKARRDRAAKAIEMQPRRDEIVNALYKTRGAEFGFTAGTDEDREKFVDYVIKDFVENKNVNPIIASPIARDFLNYETVARYGGTVEKRGDKYGAQQNLLKAYETSNKIEQQRQQILSETTESLKKRGRPDAEIVTVLETGDVVQGLPYWQKHRDNSLEKQLSTMYSGTVEGNTAGLNLDLDEYKRAQDAVLSGQVYADPNDPKQLEDRRKEIEKGRVITTFARGEKVPQRRIVLPQVLLSNGQYAVDLDKMAFDLSQLYLVDAARAKGYKYVSQLANEIGPQAMSDLRKETLTDARERMQEIQLQSLGSVLFLRDSRATAEKLARGEDFLGRYDPFLGFANFLDEVAPREGETRRSQLARMQAPWKRVLYPQAIEGLGQGTLYYAKNVEQLGDTKLNWLLEFGPYAPILSYATAQEDFEWGSPEHLMRQGKGYNIFEDSVVTEKLEKWTGSSGGALAGLMVLTLAEPDLFSAMTLPGKVLGTGVRLAAKGATGVDRISDLVDARKLAKSEQDLTTLLEKLATARDSDDLNGAISVIRDATKQGTSKEALQLAQAKAAATFGVQSGQSFDIFPQLQVVASKNAKELQALGDLDAQLGRRINEIVDIASRKLDELKVPQADKSKQLDRLETSLRRYSTQKLSQLQKEEALINATTVTGEKLVAKNRKAGRPYMGRVNSEDVAKLSKSVENDVNSTRQAGRNIRKLEKKGEALAQQLQRQRAIGQSKQAKETEGKIRANLREIAENNQQMKPGLLRGSLLHAVDDYTASIRGLENAERAITDTLRSIGVNPIIFKQAKLDDVAGAMTQAARLKERTSTKAIETLMSEIAEIRDGYSEYRKLLGMTPAQRAVKFGSLTDVSLTPFLNPKGPGVVAFDSGSWLSDLRTKVDARQIDSQLDRLNQTPRGAALRVKLRTKGVIDLNSQEVAQLKKVLAPLAEAERRTVLTPLELTENMLQAWRDSLRAGGTKYLKTTEDWAAYGAETIRELGGVVDARRSRLGKWKTNVQDTVRKALIRNDDTSDVVIYLTGKIPDKDPEQAFPTEVFRILDTSENLSIGNRVIAANKYNDFTVFQNFKAYIKDAVQGMTKKDLDTFLFNDTAFQAVTRAYLPKNTASSDIISSLTGSVYEKLLESSTAEEFASALKTATSRAYGSKGRLIKGKLSEVVVKSADGAEEYIPDYTALMFMTRGMLNGQNRYLFVQGAERALGPAMTPAAAQKANFILSGATNADDAVEKLLTQGNVGFDASEAIQAIREWGVTFNRDVMNEVCDSLQQANNATMSFQRVGRNVLGESIFAPAPLMEQITAQLDDAAKTLQATPMVSKWQKKRKTKLMEMLRIWRTSVTRGYLTPRPAYFANQMAGDFAQMLMSEGLLTLRRQKTGPRAGAFYLSGALPMSFQNAFTYVPYLGPKVLTKIEDVAEAATKKGVPSLTTPLNAWVNPFVQRILTNRHPDEAYAVIDGQLTAKQLLAEMNQRNVFDALYSEDMRKLSKDLRDNLLREPGRFGDIWSRAKSAGSAWRDYSEVLVRQTQDHQRAALYLEYRLRRGATADEAQKAVESALYDWRHSVSQWEMDHLTALGAFYPYFRLSMQQMASAIMEPLTYNVKDTVKYSILGTGRLNRARKGSQAIFGIPNWVNGNDGEDLGYAEAIQLADTRSKPSFYGGRPILMSQINPEGKMALTVGPSFGIPETLDIYMSLLEGVIGTAAMAQFPGTEDVILGEEFSREIYENVIQDQFNPLARNASKYALDAWNGTTPRSMVNVPKKYEFLIESKLPYLQSMVVPGRYGYEMPRGYKDFAEAMPIVGTEIPRVAGAFFAAKGTVLDRAEWTQGAQRGVLWMLGDLTGFTRESVGMTPTEARDMVARQIRGDVIGEVREAGGRAEGTREFLETD